MITFSSTPPSNATVGGTYTVSATGGGSGNPIVFSIDALSNAGACSVNNATVSLNAVGTCDIDANQAAGSLYSAAPKVQQSFKIAATSRAQVITFSSTPPSNATVGGTYTVSATGGGSGNPIVFSIDALSNAGACSVNNATVSLNAVGTCDIDANQAAGGLYSVAPKVQQSFGVVSGPSPLLPSVRVVGSHLVNAKGTTIRLLGVDRPGMDVLTLPGKCVTKDAVPIGPMLVWGVNAVRIPLNEDCWLGINGVSGATTASYQSSLESYVSALTQEGIYVILDLHVSAPGAIPSTGMQAMPDANHSPAFWSSVASTFINNPAVIFDLFNEPFLNDAAASGLPAGSDAWACWLSGCTLPIVHTASGEQKYTWQAAGMQQLVNAVRSTGATQPIMLSGLNYGNSLEGWLTHVPVDPLHQVIASVHVYNGDACNTLTCWTQEYAAVAKQYPVVTAEFGEHDGSDTFMDQYMQFADANGISYLGWSWSIATGGSNFALVTDWNGTPSPEGLGLETHLQALAG